MQRYTVGRNIKGKSDPVTVEAEDALAAAMQAKQQAPDAVITYVRKRNERGDQRHPHHEVANSEDNRGDYDRAAQEIDYDVVRDLSRIHVRTHRVEWLKWFPNSSPTSVRSARTAWRVGRIANSPSRWARERNMTEIL